MKDTMPHTSNKPSHIYSLFVLNTAVELAGVITVAANSEDDARAKFESSRAAEQILLSVRLDSSPTV